MGGRRVMRPHSGKVWQKVAAFCNDHLRTLSGEYREQGEQRATVWNWRLVLEKNRAGKEEHYKALIKFTCKY